MNKLSFLDLSNNEIEKLEVEELPQNLMILKMIENPVAKKSATYRKEVVVKLESLEELDRIKVIPAERLAYKGLIKINVDSLLDKFKQERQLKDARERMEQEMYAEYMSEMGVESSDRMLKSLEEFAKLDEFNDLHKQFRTIISSHVEKKKE